MGGGYLLKEKTYDILYMQKFRCCRHTPADRNEGLFIMKLFKAKRTKGVLAAVMCAVMWLQCPVTALTVTVGWQQKM